jgi:hypothetical protein
VRNLEIRLINDLLFIQQNVDVQHSRSPSIRGTSPHAVCHAFHECQEIDGAETCSATEHYIEKGWLAEDTDGFSLINATDLLNVDSRSQ